MMENKDKPGIVGHLGTVLGKYGINIANMSLCRDQKGGEALTALNIDSIPNPECIKELESDSNIGTIRTVQF